MKYSVLVCALWNILMCYFAMMLSRIVFYVCHASYFPDLSWLMLKGALVFDTSVIAYANILFLILFLLPIRNRVLSIVTKWIYVVFNGVFIVANIADITYFPHTGRRTTASVMQEFSNDGNILQIVGQEMMHSWYLVLIVIVMIYLLARFYAAPRSNRQVAETLKNKQPRSKGKARPHWWNYPLHTVYIALAIALSIAGMRGGFTTAVRPITISNANAYVQHPVEAALVLNTPFSIIRTIGKTSFTVPQYYDDKTLSEIYSPVVLAARAASIRMASTNVIVIILESFGEEYIGALNNTGKGYTPFLDSLIQHSLTFTQSFANGRKSIDAMPSILSSIPMFVEPFILTDASLNRVGGIAASLRTEDYTTAFFHGAENGSMGFEAFAKATGFEYYYGRDEYSKKKAARAASTYDGTWAIWDEPFLQFYAEEMNSMPQPFLTTVFTASSHHPFKVPDEYTDKFPKGTMPIHKCIGYTDHALRQFFNTAKRSDWYNNTLFVITADHTNQTTEPYYKTDLGVFRVPIILHDPSNPELIGRQKGVIQQIDIFPTIMQYLNYNRPYIAFGCGVLRERCKFNGLSDLRFRTHNFHPDGSRIETKVADRAPASTVNYINGIYQYVEGDFVLQFDGERTRAVYNYIADPLLQHNIVGKVPAQLSMERRLKAIIQQYMLRMTTDRLTVD